MTAVPVIRTWVAGEVVVASYFNTNINGPLSFLLAPPILEIRQSSNQNLLDATTTALTFTTEDVDSSGMHSTVSATTKCTAVYPGWYLSSGRYSPAANGTGDRFSWWMVNAADNNGSLGFKAGDATAVSVCPAATKKIFLNTGDYLELVGFQSSTGTLGTGVTTREQSTISMQWASN